MEFIESGILTTFEVTFIDPGLFVRAAIYDMTTGVPVGPVNVNMTELTPGTYYGTFTPVAGKVYLIIDRVYTDGTYTTLDANYPPNSEAAQSVDIGAGFFDELIADHLLPGTIGAALNAAAYKSSCVIIGTIVNSQIIAAVVPPPAIVGVVRPEVVVGLVAPDAVIATIQC